MHKLAANIVSLPYISAYTFRYFADHGWLFSYGHSRFISALPNGIDVDKVRDGDVIFITTNLIERFFLEVDPKLRVRYTLISGHTDRGVDQRLARMISPNVIHWYTHNNTSSHERISTIPLGLLNLHWRFDGHPQSDINLITAVSSEDITPTKDILVSFSVKTNPQDRLPCYQYFSAQHDIVTLRPFDNDNGVKRDFVTEYFREIRRHKFVVCPFGNGFDCHRNWETFSLGGIPIIKKHKSMETFYDMPAWFVDDWSDVDKYSLDNMHDYMMANWASYNHDKKYFDYWQRRLSL